MLLQFSHFPLCSPPPCTPPPTCIPHLQFMSMGHTYKFFGFSISHTLLTLPLSIFYLPFMLLILCTFSSSLSPTHLLLTFHVISISVILYLFQLFALFSFLFQGWRHTCCAVMLYVGEGPRGNCAACSTLCRLSVTSPATHKQTGPFWCWFPGGRMYILGPRGSLQRTLL